MKRGSLMKMVTSTNLWTEINHPACGIIEFINDAEFVIYLQSELDDIGRTCTKVITTRGKVGWLNTSAADTVQRA